jgi:putative endonuclease
MPIQPLGPRGEDLAVAYLLDHHYRILHRNYRHGHLEIDVVAMDGSELVFVEVKARSSFQYGEPEYFVTEAKQERLRRAAQAYVEERVTGLVPCRFDVIAIAERDGTTEVRHLKNAFEG